MKNYSPSTSCECFQYSLCSNLPYFFFMGLIEVDGCGFVEMDKWNIVPLYNFFFERCIVNKNSPNK